MSNLQDFYENFMISSFGKIEMTKLAQLTGHSHDMFTKNLLLNNDFDDDKRLWQTIKPFLRNYENKNSGCILIDDMLMHKPYTKINDIVCWHYDHVSQAQVKGILMLNFHYTDESGISIPLGYELISKTNNVWNEQYQKFTKKSVFTKNEIMQDKLRILHFHNELQYKYILFDKWFASVKNIVFIEEELKKLFVCPRKSNRKNALTLENRNNGNNVNISSANIEGGSSCLVYIEGYEKPLRLIKQVVTRQSLDL